MVFHRSVSDSKSPQVSRTILRILAVLRNAVIWIVSTNPNWYNRHFHVPQFFQFSSKVEVLILRYILWSTGTAKSTILQILFFFLLIIIRSGLLAGIRWSVCMSQSHWSLCVSFSRTCACLCIYHLLVWSNLNFLHISLWFTLPTQSCQVLYLLFANLLQ